MEEKLNSKRLPWLLLSLLVLVICTALGLISVIEAILSPSQIVIHTEFSQEEIFDTAHIYYDLGEGYCEENKIASKKYDSKNEKFVFDVPPDILLNSEKLRFDIFVEEYSEKNDSLRIRLLDVRLQKGIFKSRTLKEIEDYVEEIEDLNQIKKGVYVLLGDDPIWFLDDNILSFFKTEDDKVTAMTVAFLLVFVILLVFNIFVIIKYGIKHIRQVCLWIVNIKDRFCRMRQDKRLLDVGAIFIIVLLTVFLYRKYIFGKYYFLFVNMAGDSFNQTYPMLMNWAYRIQNGINSTGWDFYNGFGTEISHIGLFIESWVCFFGAENVAYLMGISQVLKVIFSGVFFYCFLRITNKRRSTSLIFALSYAYCGHMIGRQMWTYYPNEVLLVAIWLCCFELYFTKKDWRWLPLASLLMALNSGPYSILLYFLFFTGYGIFRYCTTEKFIFSKAITYFVKFFLVNWSVFFLICGIQFANGLIGEMSSDRFQKVAANYTESENVEQVEISNKEGRDEKRIFSDYDCIRTVFYRTLSTDILGIEEGEYSGYGVYLSGPVLYCGLLTILILPFGFGKLDKKRKIWYALLLTAGICYTIFEQFRVLCNGFANDNFKQSSFWIIVLLIVIAADCFETVVFQKKTGNLIALLLMIMGIGLLQIFYMFSSDLYYNKIRLLQIICFLILYLTAILCYFSKRINSTIFLSAVIVLKCAEVIILNYNAIIYSSTLSTGTVKGNYTYEGYYKDAIEYIKDIEESNAYRIDNQTAVSYSDSLVQRYMGTSIYLGGTATQIEGVRTFYQNLQLPRTSDISGRLARVSVSDEINSLCGVKYLTSNFESIYNFGYELVDTLNGVGIYRNQYSLPLGFVYDKTISEEEFNKLSVTQKREAILQACVVEEQSAVTADEMDYYLATLDLEQYSIEFECVDENIYAISEQPENAVIVVKPVITRETDMVSGAAFTYLYAGDKNSNMDILSGCDRTIIQTDKGTFEYTYAANYKNITQFRFELGENIYLEDIRFYAVPKEVYYKKYIESIQQLNSNQKSNFQIDEKNSALVGWVDSETDGMLYLSIPYNEKWKLLIDGTEQEIVRTNYAFMGTPISTGKHSVELVYRAADSQTDWIKLLLKYIGYIIIVINFVTYYIIKKRSERI